MQHSEKLTVSTPWGPVKNVPTHILGWLMCAAIALYLVHAVTTRLESRVLAIETSVREQNMLIKEQTQLLRDIRDAVRK
jgi:hypothetical protein